ncbi:MAG TPA: hypothetical protein VIG55_07500 [Methylosinus sp.]
MHEKIIQALDVSAEQSHLILPISLRRFLFGRLAVAAVARITAHVGDRSAFSKRSSARCAGEAPRIGAAPLSQVTPLYQRE